MCKPTARQKAEMMMHRFKTAYPKRSKEEIKELTLDAANEMMRIYFSNYREKDIKYWEQVKEEIEKL